MSVMEEVHEYRAGKIQLVKIQGQFGMDFIIGSLYGPTESAPEEEKIAFWSLVKEHLQALDTRNVIS